MNKHTITVCMGSSCFARGNQENLDFIEDYIAKNNLDAKIELAGSRCEGKCATGPNIVIDDNFFTEVTKEKLEQLLKELE